jgi:hypothetical protein
LPFACNAVVIVLGESDTDSPRPWFEIMRRLIAQRCPDDGIQAGGRPL